ncbi:MAG TPA: uroporphyrinogen-III C-methyltransferase [Alphaproteobacteria bacterium]|nr:uroporphyrinogen-III C-methyltransferase [Alphaproteobacteria bacterium]
MSLLDLPAGAWRATHPPASTRRPRLPEFERGSVWLVGAGPGDPGLLTLLAVRALEEADIIVHDALVSPEILDFARPDVELDDVGKRAGRPSPRQEEINARLIRHARRGLRVLRLKGGDPFVFGRGGEEALDLAAAGVPFRVVPGVTSGLGGLAYAGIPATHRGLGNSVTLVTATDSRGELPEDLDWAGLARARSTVVFYMGLRKVDRVAANLLAAGRDAATPAAIVSAASTPRQTAIYSTLGELAADAARFDPAAPALIVVGEVVGLADALAHGDSAMASLAAAL